MNTALLRRLFTERLLEAADLPDIKWEGVPFQAGESTYLEVEVRGNTSAGAATGVLDSRPLLLLTIHTPPTRVIADMDVITDALSNAFQPGRTMVDDADSLQLEITTLNIGGLRILDSGWGYRRITVTANAWSLRTPLLTA